MALDTAKEWKAEAPEWMVERLRDVPPPGSMEDCLRDEGWASTYYFFAKANYATENLDFIAQVDEFNRSGSMDLAKQIYNEFVPLGAPQQVNLKDNNRTYLEGIFKDQDEPVGPPDLFADAYKEIFSMTENDSYNRFKNRAGTVQTELAAEIDWDNVEGREHS